MKIFGKRDKQKRQNAKTTTYRHIVIFLICSIIVCTASYLLQTPRTETDSFNKSRPNDTNKNIISKIKWAQPLQLPGLKNFHKVSDELYRGAQPTAEGMEQLKKLGIKTIINLRLLHSDRDEIVNIGLNYEHIRMTTWNPEIEDAVRFLKIVTDSNRTPVFVHCKHGADRTGTMCAIYRIAVQNWTKEQAIQEMTQGDFGFHSIWSNLIDYIHELDIDQIKQDSGLVE